MKLIFDDDGYFCEGAVPKKWELFMEFGKVMLTEEKLSLIKQSNISLVASGASVDDFNEGFIIPLTNIKKVYVIKESKVFVVKVETRDGHVFSITMAHYKKKGEGECRILAKEINITILSSVVMDSNDSNAHSAPDDSKMKVCPYCNHETGAKGSFCNNCGAELN